MGEARVSFCLSVACLSGRLLVCLPRLCLSGRVELCMRAGECEDRLCFKMTFILFIFGVQILSSSAAAIKVKDK